MMFSRAGNSLCRSFQQHPYVGKELVQFSKLLLWELHNGAITDRDCFPFHLMCEGPEHSPSSAVQCATSPTHRSVEVMFKLAHVAK